MVQNIWGVLFLAEFPVSYYFLNFSCTFKSTVPLSSSVFFFYFLFLMTCLINYVVISWNPLLMGLSPALFTSALDLSFFRATIK
jgi:hypothetical protein